MLKRLLIVLLGLFLVGVSGCSVRPESTSANMAVASGGALDGVSFIIHQAPG